MTVKKSLIVITTTGVCFGIAGALLGYALGAFAPAYYRGVFRGGNDPRFIPVQVGLGLGATQGLGCGIAVGTVVVLAAALYGPRNLGQKAVGVLEADDLMPGSQRSFPVKLVLGFFGVLATILFVGVTTFVVGEIIGQELLYRRWTSEKLAKIWPVLQEPQFAALNAESSSAAQVYLNGTVPSEKAYKTLEDRIRFLFGDAEAKFMMGNVSVAQNQ